MSKLTIDKETWIAVPLFTLGAASTLGLISPTLLGIDLGQTLFGLNGVEFSISRAISIVALGIVLFNRDIAWGKLGGIDIWVVYVTIGLIIAPPFFPIFEDTMLQAPYAVVAFLIQTMGITLASYIN